jgi:hypothetical protein
MFGLLTRDTVQLGFITYLPTYATYLRPQLRVSLGNGDVPADRHMACLLLTPSA